MPKKYVVASTEKLKKTASETETKALLYLMNKRTDSDQIYYFIVDFFNDVTGMDSWGKKLWDVQSKANKNITPKALGRELVTLYKNFLSEFEFEVFILFVGGVSNSICKDSTKSVFGIENLKETAIVKIKEGLIDEGKKKTYIEKAKLVDTNINDFLKRVLVVTDNGQKPHEYIGEIVKQYPRLKADEERLTAIFNEIRDAQASLKHSSVENVEIHYPEEALEYYRYLTAKRVRLMIIQRLIGSDILSSEAPLSFSDVLNHCPIGRRRSMIEECQQNVVRIFFHSSGKEDYWRLLEKIYDLTLEYPDSDLNFLYKKLIEGEDFTSLYPDFDVLSMKFFIAKIKDGIQK